MLWKLSWAAHKRLPREVRQWMDLEDVYQEAAVEALRSLTKWSQSRGTSQTTYTQYLVQNRLSSLVTYWSAKKRTGLNIVSETKIEKEQERVTLDPVVDAVIAAWYPVPS